MSEGDHPEQGVLTNVAERRIFLPDTNSKVVSPAFLELSYFLAFSLFVFSSTFSGNFLYLKVEVQKCVCSHVGLMDLKTP